MNRTCLARMRRSRRVLLMMISEGMVQGLSEVSIPERFTICEVEKTEAQKRKASGLSQNRCSCTPARDLTGGMRGAARRRSFILREWISLVATISASRKSAFETHCTPWIADLRIPASPRSLKVIFTPPSSSTRQALYPLGSMIRTWLTIILPPKL